MQIKLFYYQINRNNSICISILTNFTKTIFLDVL